MKPNYALIRIKAGRELVTVINRLLKHERIDDLDGVHYAVGKQYFYCAMISGDRFIVVKHLKGTKQARVQEYELQSWKDYMTERNQPDLVGFVDRYLEESPFDRYLAKRRVGDLI